MKYSVFIDESGEAGIAKVRQEGSVGASPYFVVGAAVFQPASELNARNVLQDVKSKMRKVSWKHATDLSHTEKVYLGRELGRLPVRYFAVISNKDTLGEYKNFIETDAQKFYNKCLKYLLEIIFLYLSKDINSTEDVTVVLEERNHDYDAMLRYFHKVKENPIYKQSKSLRFFNPFSMIRKKKGEENLLEIADFVSHAVYQLANKTDRNFYIPEFRYFQEISSRFAGNERGQILGYGLKCIHSLGQLNLDPDIAALVRSAKCKPPS